MCSPGHRNPFKRWIPFGAGFLRTGFSLAERGLTLRSWCFKQVKGFNLNFRVLPFEQLLKQSSTSKCLNSLVVSRFHCFCKRCREYFNSNRHLSGSAGTWEGVVLSSTNFARWTHCPVESDCQLTERRWFEIKFTVCLCMQTGLPWQ